MRRPNDLIIEVAADIIVAAGALDLTPDQVAHEAVSWANYVRKGATAKKLQATPDNDPDGGMVPPTAWRPTK